MTPHSLKRLPIYSLVSGCSIAAVATGAVLTGVPIPRIGLGAMGLIPLAAALVDSIRLRQRFPQADATSQSGAGQGSGQTATTDAELQSWIQQRTETLNERERELNVRSLALQQWMQFPDAIDFQRRESLGNNLGASRTDDVTPSLALADPMAGHDKELFDLIEKQTRQLFDDIKADSYRHEVDGKKVFDNAKIRDDMVQLVSSVAAIYRPDDPSPLLRTNVEALSRASGRASLRFLVAIENLPGGISGYDFQTIYNVVIRAVQTYGMYKSAKPYLDVASGLLFAGRVVSSTNPITLVAWYAASRATTYGASKLGSHVIDQQAVGLIRQLVEIVAIEIASLYSPMIRYRDLHWVYGVELVHLASELSLSEKAKMDAMAQLSALQLRDEYGRVSLMRHLAGGTTSRPHEYCPSKSLSLAERMTIAERLESFLISNVLNDANSKSDLSTIERWQTSAAERLEIQFRSGHVDASSTEQNERAVWSLAAFALQHLGDEPDTAVTRLSATRCWHIADTQTHNDWIRLLQSDPPYLYHAPVIDPNSKVCNDYLDDLIELAASELPPRENDLSAEASESTEITLPPWSGRTALQVTAYFLRTDAPKYLERYRQAKIKRLFGERDQGTLASTEPGLLDAFDYLSDSREITCVYSDAKVDLDDGSEKIEKAYLAIIGRRWVCFSVHSDQPTAPVELIVHADCTRQDARVEKVAGYVRSDCRIHLPGACKIELPGSSLRGYDSYFAALLS